MLFLPTGPLPVGSVLQENHNIHPVDNGYIHVTLFGHQKRKCLFQSTDIPSANHCSQSVFLCQVQESHLLAERHFRL